MTRTARRRGGAVLAAGSVLALLTGCTATGTDTTTPSPSSSPRRIASDRALQEAVLGRLPRAARTGDALTWTTAEPRAIGSTIDMTDRRLLLAAACDGGGTVTVSVGGTPDRVLHCDGLRTLGPIDVSAALGTDPPGGAEFDVAVTGGRPHWFARAAAVDTVTSR